MSRRLSLATLAAAPLEACDGIGRIATGEHGVSGRRSNAVRALLVQAGLDMIAEVGLDGVTVRSLAKRTHYAPSTIGYHTSPMRSFFDQLWQELAHRFATEVLSASKPDTAWNEEAARRIVAWAACEPNLTQFLLQHTPTDTNQLLWTLSSIADRTALINATETSVPLGRFIIRRFQASLELGLAMQPTADSVAIIAELLRNPLCQPDMRQFQLRAMTPRRARA